MCAPFPIMELPDDAPEAPEQMGSKEKFWFRWNGARWLFKYPRPGTGEHWAEKVAAELAGLLNIQAANVEFALYQLNKGSATRSFADRAAGRALIHGNEVLAVLDAEYDMYKKRHQSDHNLDRIIKAVGSLFQREAGKQALERLAGYVILDALLGNVDRHHENWGVLLTSAPDVRPRFEVAPTFDHASSLGRELRAVRQSAILATPGGISAYIRRGHGAIFLAATDKKGASPMALATFACRKHPEFFTPWLEAVAGLDKGRVEGIVLRIPEGWMSEESRRFVVEFVWAAREMLLEGAS